MTRPAFILFFILLSSSVFAQVASLKQKITQIISDKKATVGVSVVGIESKETLIVNGEKHYPMQSVFKFHIALAVLNQVDLGKLNLDQKIYIKKSELLPDTWSPIRKKYPDGEISLTLAEILTYTVAQSDNNGCDILLRLIGGPQIVNEYLHNIGIKDVSIQVNEETMQKEWSIQFSNWTTPKAATDLLLTLFHGKILSKSSTEFLWKTLVETSTGPKRVKGSLPATIVAHKTGTSGTSEAGVMAAVNDIGIVTLPDGKHFAISVLVTDSSENLETNEKIIADIAKVTWDYFVTKTK